MVNTRRGDPLTFLRELQGNLGGAIPVERFVQEALYHPTYGYYSSQIRTVGARGDFSTAPTLGNSLARSIAGWLVSNRRSTWKRWHVIEAGAGTGMLASNILRCLGFFDRLGLVYHIVETSPVLRLEQQRLLRRSRVVWHDSMASAIAAASGNALIFSNELLDAFAPRVFQKQSEGWLEVAVKISGSSVAECLIPSRPPESTAFQIDFPVGQRIEVHNSAAEWFASWIHRLQSGKILTIDYGEKVDQLYHRRPNGTLRAYYHHARFEGLDVYHRFGKQDITADVNFSDLVKWGESLGLNVTWYGTQTAFFGRYASSGKHPPPDEERFLADLSGAGGAFKCLEFERDPDP